MSDAQHLGQVKRARRRVDAATANLHDEIRAALLAGVALRKIAGAAGLSHEQIRRIGRGAA